MSYPGTAMVTLLTSERSQIFALILMLLAVAFGYYKGRNAAVVSGQSLTWTQIPLIALAIISIGPSIVAVVLYLAYTFGIIQPGAYGFRFSHVFIFELPIDFALLNWPFVALYLVCRIWPKFGAARLADVVFRHRDVSPKCTLVSIGAGDGYKCFRRWPRHWYYRSHAQFAYNHDHLAWRISESF